MKNNLVSVIVAIFNIEKYVRYSVESVIKQSYKNLEIILVDDGSTDKSGKICDELAKLDTRIKVIHKKNGGLSEARNAGIDIAKGSYIIFLDGDDKMEQEAVSILLNSLQKNNADVVMTDYCFIKNIEDEPLIDNSNYEETVIKEKDVFDLIFNKRYPMIMLAWGKIYKKEIFESIRFPVGKIHEDDFILHRVLNKCKKFVHISTKLYLNLLRPGSITASKFNVKRFDAIQARIDRVNFCKKERPEYYQESINHVLRAIMLNYTYARMSKMKKEEYYFLVSTFNKYYELLEHKNMLCFAFKHFRNCVYCVLKFYVKKKKLLFNEK